MHKKHRFGAGTEQRNIVQARGRADSDQALHPLVGATQPHTHRRTERETGNEDFMRVRLLFEQIIQRRPRIFGLAAPFVINAGAVANAAKIEAQGFKTRFLQSACGAHDNFVVHRAAKLRVWVKSERHPRSLQVGWAIECL